MKEQEGKIVKKIAKKNQIVIATLAVMIAAAGYMNYSGKLFPGKTKTQETNSELANKELLDISDEDTSVSSGDIKSQDGDTGSTDGNASSITPATRAPANHPGHISFRPRGISRALYFLRTTFVKQ